MQLSLNSESNLPLVDQIVNAIRNLADDRVLRPGMRLPPIRKMASDHGISRFTVVEAYDRLVALGYLQSRRGSGFYLTARQETPAIARRSGEIERAFDNAGVMHQSLDDEAGRLKVGVGWLPPEWLDEEGIRRTIRTLARRADTKVVSYGTAQGYRPLRNQLQIKLGELSIAADPAQIILTNGASQALDLIARYLLRSGDCVFVDDPGYWNLFANLRLYGVNLVGVPRTLDGPDVLALENLLAEHQPKVFFTHSVLHNPTARSITPSVAFRLLQLAEKHDFLIVEDDINADFHPGSTTRLAQLDQLRRVIYIGSFSKTLSANLRVGFLAANPELAAELTDVKIVSCLSTSEFSERLVYLMLTEGHYRKLTERTQNRLAEATTGTLKLLEKSGMKIYAEPKGGMFVWAAVPGLQDSARLASQAAQSGILLAPGNIFRPQMQPSPWLRFNVAYALDPKLERFLGEALG
ncbi:MAG: PLP-dependent aminotransferase family protein [Betaproteobacteria bacterium]